jgi:hypothetical protein
MYMMEQHLLVLEHNPVPQVLAVDTVVLAVGTAVLVVHEQALVLRLG